MNSSTVHPYELSLTLNDTCSSYADASLVSAASSQSARSSVSDKKGLVPLPDSPTDKIESTLAKERELKSDKTSQHAMV